MDGENWSYRTPRSNAVISRVGLIYFPDRRRALGRDAPRAAARRRMIEIGIEMTRFFSGVLKATIATRHTGPQHAVHLGQCPPPVWEVDQADARDHRVERGSGSSSVLAIHCARFDDVAKAASAGCASANARIFDEMSWHDSAVPPTSRAQ